MDYGLVATCVIRGNEVTNVAVSCRGIGLNVGPVLVAACLRVLSLDRPGTLGRLERTERNTPARWLFEQLGFRGYDHGRWLLEDTSNLGIIREGPHRGRITPSSPDTVHHRPGATERG